MIFTQELIISVCWSAVTAAFATKKLVLFFTHALLCRMWEERKDRKVRANMPTMPTVSGVDGAISTDISRAQQALVGRLK